ncbi:MAG: response regulator [Candidatus Aminicenantes bacterium]|nr:response regulator [Candidatus Aminicenantes bacterium]
MKNPEELRQEIERLRNNISQLTAASVRITASLNVDTVLREIVKGARELTGADCGLIATLDDSGQIEDFVSSGLTSDEHRKLSEWSDGPRLFEYFRNLPGAVRLRDAKAFVRTLGFSFDLLPWAKGVQGTPMRHRGVHVGNFFLIGGRDRREFTSEDEEILVLFASQAAVAIANARTYRDEQRARADLEALINTSPVGVVVFDAKSIKPVSFNREAKRLVEGLLTPGCPFDQLLDIIKCRRADGQEVSLEKLPLVQTLSDTAPIRAEEVVLHVPDGRSLTTLVNATPIRSEDGTIESMVVTLQDLESLKETERLRAEFLGLVSHELRAPLTSIKGSAAAVLGATLPPAEMRQFFRIINEQADHMLGVISDLLDAGHIETGTLSVAPEPSDIARLVDKARGTFLSGGGRHTVHIDLPLDLPRVMADRQRIVQVLNNLLSNAARYSPESSPIRIGAVRDGFHVAISVSDEGRGVPPDLLPHLFRKHVRLGDGGIRGSGLGLAICKGLVEAHGGRIQAESDGVGLGSRFTFTIPVAEESAARDAPGSGRGVSRPSRKGREPASILVVDDDPQMLRYVRDTLAAAGYSSHVTGDPREVPELIRTARPRLVLLDLMLPETDGIELMESVPELADRPVIFISGYGRDETIARALDNGAADYIVKPFSRTELVARVRAALRRNEEPKAPFRLADLVIDYENRRVTLADRQLRLTATEYEMLRLLSVNAGGVVTYDSLFRHVWGQRRSEDLRPIRSVVKNLRRKLGDDAAKPSYIFNERQIGYGMAKPSDS